MSKRDYYDVLCLDRDADPEAIKRAYRRLALECHPDRNPHDRRAEERFKEVSEAYQVLSDPEKRDLYDRYGHAGLSRSGYAGFSGMEDIFSHFEDVFGDFFGFGFGGRRGSGRRAAPRQGRDVRKLVHLTLREAAFGTTKTVRMGRSVRCGDCGGSGARAGTSATPCGTCRGRGQVVHSRGAFVLTTTCGDCGGGGAVIGEPCPACRGEGQRIEERDLEVRFPAGIDDGVSIRIAGQGEPGASGGPPGNLLVTVRIEPDPIFRREGDDIHADIAVGFARAALGATVRIETLEGEEEIDIPPGTQPGDRIRLPGRGIPRMGGPGRGDLVAVVRIEVPRKLTRKQKRLLAELLEEETE